MKLLTLIPFFFSSLVFAADVSESVYIKIFDQKTFELIKNRPEFTLDHITSKQFELYGPMGMKDFLLKNKIAFENIKPLSKSIYQDYPTSLEVENILKNLAFKYPKILKLYSIGKSVKGKDLWVMKISRNVEVDDNRPEFKYIANMHGDEIAGRELMLRLIKYLAENDGVDPRITNLISKYQMHIMPSMNPDGADLHRRGNANNADLNRDFPDFSTSDNKNIPDNRQIETRAVMKWQKEHNFILSANFHGGAEVANYPWDTIPGRFPEEELVKDMCLEYAHNASYIGASTVFQNGITNGYAWYEVNGGMQDWSIYYHHDFHITIELTNTKWPSFGSLNYYFEQNKEALISYIENIEKIKSMGH